MDEERFYAEFGQRFADRRRSAEMTQAEVAALAGTSRASVANIEAGRQKVYLHQLYRLAAALRLEDLSDLLPLEIPRRRAASLIEAPEDLTDLQRSQIEGVLKTAIANAKPVKRRK